MSGVKLSRYADYVPVAVIVAGFALIALAWNGAASLDYTQGQIPYLISGGMGGVGLVMFGAGSMIVRAMRKAQAEQAAHFEELLRAVAQGGSTLTYAGNGQPETVGDLVVVGASSFHLEDCRLVGKRETISKVSRDEAMERGLQPCRICNP